MTTSQMIRKLRNRIVHAEKASRHRRLEISIRAKERAKLLKEVVEMITEYRRERGME